MKIPEIPKAPIIETEIIGYKWEKIPDSLTSIYLTPVIYDGILAQRDSAHAHDYYSPQARQTSIVGEIVMTKWEYLKCGFWNNWVGLGTDGWELVAVIQERDGVVYGYFKRQVTA